MTIGLGWLLALACTAQTQGTIHQGTVVDDQGKPVAGARVVFWTSAGSESSAESARPHTETDAAGQFHLATPRARWNDASKLWIYQPGRALKAVSGRDQLAGSIVLKKPQPRAITIEGPDGKPITGAKIWPRSIFFDSPSRIQEVPHALAPALAATTGADGKVVLEYMAAADTVVALYVEAEPIGTQCFPLVEQLPRTGSRSSIVIRLKPVNRLAGRVKTRTNQPVEGQAVEIWSQGNRWTAASQVKLADGPIRTNADGSFQTPDKLLAGTAYRAVVRAPGMEPALSDWITIGGTPHVLPPFVLRPLRTISGRAVARQGKPLAGIEVSQSGDGPERTSTVTDAEGRFTLGGFCQGPVFVFARGDGFRFSGRLIKAGEAGVDVTLGLTRLTERPAREMRMLPDPIPLDESRALARRLIEPYWKGFDDRTNADKVSALRSLVRVDPIGVLQKLDGVKFEIPTMKGRILNQLVRTLVQIDPAEAETVAEAIDEPSGRCRNLLLVADALPDQERAHKLAVLERAHLQARNARAPSQRAGLLSLVAARWYDTGDREKARALFAGGASADQPGHHEGGADT